jgi:hypothetical protein
MNSLLAKLWKLYIRQKDFLIQKMTKIQSQTKLYFPSNTALTLYNKCCRQTEIANILRKTDLNKGDNNLYCSQFGIQLLNSTKLEE